MDIITPQELNRRYPQKLVHKTKWKQPEQDNSDIIACIIGFMLFLLILGVVFFPRIARGEEYPDNLWQGLIAEDTSGDYQIYLAIASVVRNRLKAGMNHGLVALKRKNLDHFIKQNSNYILKTKGIDLTLLVTKALTEVWQGKDYANGATHYEHTGHYPIPVWAKNMQVVKVMYQGTKQEITFWKYNRLAKNKTKKIY